MSEYGGITSGGEASTVPHALVEHAFSLWRDATAYLARIASSERRAAYEDAIGFGVTFLQRHDSMQSLLEAYYAPHETEATNWVESACRTGYPGRILNWGIVEDVAYAQRAQQLIATALGATS